MISISSRTGSPTVLADVGTLGMLDDRYTVNSNGLRDTNIVDELKLRASAGVSIHWRSPMGPIRFDLSHVIGQQDYDKTAQQDVEAYGLVDVSAGYKFNANYDVRVGVNNVFDKQILRGGNASSSGANTYNQPGRAVFAALNINF